MLCPHPSPRPHRGGAPGQGAGPLLDLTPAQKIYVALAPGATMIMGFGLCGIVLILRDPRIVWRTIGSLRSIGMQDDDMSDYVIIPAVYRDGDLPREMVLEVIDYTLLVLWLGWHAVRPPVMLLSLIAALHVAGAQ